jgi:aromatic ring-cleaving dioxygenase
MFEVEMEPDGPFVTAQFAVFVPLEWFSRVVPWFMQRHGQVGWIDGAGGPPGSGVPRPDFSILVHPCSG